MKKIKILVDITLIVILFFLLYRAYSDNNAYMPSNKENLILDIDNLPPSGLHHYIIEYIKYNPFEALYQGIVLCVIMIEFLRNIWVYILGFTGVPIAPLPPPPAAAPPLQEAASSFEDMSIVWTLDNLLTNIFAGFFYIIIIVILAVIMKRFWNRFKNG